MESLKLHLQELYLVLEEPPDLVHTLLQSNYFLGNHSDIHELKGIFECMEDPNIFATWFRNSKELLQPLMHYYKDLAFDELPKSLSERQKFLSAYFEAIRFKRFDEMCLMKMKRCLEKGQIERFKKISQHLVMNRKTMVCPKLVQGSRELKSYLDRIRKLHEEGHNEKSRETASVCDFNDSDMDWTWPLCIAANLDSANNASVLEAMIKSLEKNYRADLHRLALQLASILARKKDITPLNFGIHCLPEEIVQVSKVMNNEEDEGKIHLWLERIAEKLDNPNANVDDWLLLRQILLKVMKMENNSSMQKEIFNSVFDPMRAKAWSKMHFKTRYSNHEIFCQTLYAKVFPMEGNPLSQEYKKVFDEISTQSYINEKFQMNSSKKQESQLDLSRKCSKFHSNFHEMLYQAVDLRRDIGRFRSMNDELLKLHVVLRFLEDHYLFPSSESTPSTKHRFMRVNLGMAKQVLSGNPKNDKNIEQIMKLIEQERCESIANFIYQTSSKVIEKQSFGSLQEACPKKKFLGKSTSKKLKLVVTHTLSSSDRELLQVQLSKIACIQLNGLLKQYVDFVPFEKAVKNIRNNLEVFCQSWDVKHEVIKKSLQDIETLVHRPIPIKYAMRSVFNRESYQSLNPNLLFDFFSHYFDHLFIK